MEMAQVQRMKDMEQYIKKLGELMNLVYKKMVDTESRVSSLDSELSRLKTEVGSLKAQGMTPDGGAVPRNEYEAFADGLVRALGSILPKEEVVSEAGELPP
jgi:hypothetical protein